MEVRWGIRAHDILKNTTIEELTDAIEKIGIKNLQLVINKALKDTSYGEENVLRIKKAVENHGMHIAMLGGYFNPVHPNHEEVVQGKENFLSLLGIEKEIGADYVGSETGSYNGSPWIYVPKNQTEEGYQESKAVFVELKDRAEKIGAQMVIEGAYGHVMYKPSVLKRLYDELHSKNVHIVMDLYNDLCVENFARRDEIFHEALSTFGNEVKIIHLKDAKVIGGKLVQLAPGEGDFHFGYMFSEIKKYCPDAYCVFEGVGPEHIEKSFAYLKDVARGI